VTVRGLVFVPTAEEAPPPRQGAAIVVLNTTWTPTHGDRPDLISARQALGRVVERVDLFDRSLQLVDRWAEMTAIADTLTVEGTTYWYRLREPMWRWVHERMLWRLVIADLERQGPIAEVELRADEPALADIVRTRWPDAAIQSADAQPIDRPSHAGAPRPPFVARVARRLRALVVPRRPAPGAGDVLTERERREAILASRVEALAASSRPRVIVLTNPGTHQRIGAPGGRRQDPLFGVVIPRLAERGYQPVLLATGLDQRRDEQWALIEEDEQALPQYLLATRWSQGVDDDRAARAVESVDSAIRDTPPTPMDLDGLDVSAPFRDALRSAATALVRTDVRMLARVERLIAELRPSAILLAQEGIRTPWLIAGRRGGIPVVAVQHGVLYAGHAGYPPHRHPSLCLPSRTCVYGDFERDVLLELAYEPREVVVTGSPRLDLDALATADATDDERAAVRRELDVAEGDRLLVVSAVNLRFLQRSHFAHMLEAVLGEPLPAVHVVVKQHPGERDDGPYRDLIEGLARAGGYVAPPITVVKDIDLYRLLRAADAHLGLLSTVLTEAVVTGTPNLLAVTDAHADLLGYVAAGVAQPVRTTADLLAALTDPRPPTAAARKAFLARHFRRGDATGRIVEAVVRAKPDRPAAVPSRAV
jgi:hypothetical protein